MRHFVAEHPFIERHVLPKHEPDKHVVGAGPNCPCEPICVHAEKYVRIFLHRTEHIGIASISHERKPLWWVVS